MTKEFKLEDGTIVVKTYDDNGSVIKKEIKGEEVEEKEEEVKKEGEKEEVEKKTKKTK